MNWASRGAAKDRRHAPARRERVLAAEDGRIRVRMSAEEGAGVLRVRQLGLLHANGRPARPMAEVLALDRHGEPITSGHHDARPDRQQWGWSPLGYVGAAVGGDADAVCFGQLIAS